MMNKSRSLLLAAIFITAITAALLLLMPSEISAHRMLIEEISEGSVEVGFDDGTVADNVEVRLYDAEENVIEEGTTDQEGIYEYDSDLDVERVVAEDDMGHRADLIPGESGGEEGFIQSLPVWLRTTAGVGVLLLTAVMSKYFRKDKGDN